MRILFALPGLHRQNRGAEMAFISIAKILAELGDTVTLIGSGNVDPAAPYKFVKARSVSRERFESFPFVPVLRHEYAYEELTFAPSLFRRYRPNDYDITLTCSYPFTNWILRRPVLGASRPPHIFVTENGDWPAISDNSEFRYFGCEGLVCTNHIFYERNKKRWRSRFIPNGVDCDRFSPGLPERDEFGLPANRLIVLMVSALIPSKRVEVGIEAVSRIPDAHLVVAGDGPLRQHIEAVAEELIPERFTRLSVAPTQMPRLYRSADVFLHLSKNESSSLAFLEALACGLPVVAHDLPQLRYIVGEDEFLVDTEDPQIVATQIKRARESSQEKSMLRSRKAEAFSWRSITGRYRTFIEEVLDASQPTH